MTVRTCTFSQAPQAVRSARGSRWDREIPAGASAYRAFQVDKRDSFGLTVQVHRLRDIPSATAIRAVVRTQSFPPSWLKALSTTPVQILRVIVLRYESRTRFRRRLGEADNNRF